MNIRLWLLAITAGIAVGGLGFLIRMTQTVDNDLHQERLQAIRLIDSLDVALNRAVTESRATSMTDMTDARSNATRQLGDALTALEDGRTSLRGLAPHVDSALDAFLETIQDKFEIAFDFEARNVQNSQRLIGGLDSVPLRAAEVMAAVSPAHAERVRGVVAQVQTEVMSFGISPSPVNKETIEGLLAELRTLTENEPQAFRDTVGTLASQVENVITDKMELVTKLADMLNRPTGAQLRALEQAYVEWHGAQVAQANQFRLALAAYAGVLMVGLLGLGWRLRASYRALDDANEQLKQANLHLEEQVEERTKDLRKTLNDLRESEAQLIQSEKMASLGQMVAGVAHEINTPLGYARSNAGIIRSALSDLRGVFVAQGEALRVITSSDATDESVAQAIADASAHTDAVNPEQLVGELDGLLGDTDHGLMQIADLVGSLKDFSRVDRTRTDLFNVNDGIEAALKIVNSQIKGRIEVIRKYGKLPQVECSPSQLNQVFLNLFTNAAQAIEGNGKILVHTSPEPDGVAIRVLDTGCGMPEEVRARIFEPFFTTKPVGKGTGLGLSIVFRIVEEHGGRIDVRSAPGKGSEFTIRLPLKHKASAAPGIASAPADAPISASPEISPQPALAAA